MGMLQINQVNSGEECNTWIIHHNKGLVGTNSNPVWGAWSHMSTADVKNVRPLDSCQKYINK